MREKEHIEIQHHLSFARARAADDLCRAARETGVAVSDLDQRTYRRWWLRRPSQCNMPTDICIIFGSWDDAKDHAQEIEQPDVAESTA